MKLFSEKTSNTLLSKTRFSPEKLSARQTNKRHPSILVRTVLTEKNLMIHKSSVNPPIINKSLTNKCFYEQCFKVLNAEFSIKEIDFNLPFAKKFFLPFWVKRHLTIGHGKPILTVDLYKYYQQDMQKECTPDGILDERVFFKNIEKCMIMFSIRVIKINMTRGRGYAGITYCDLTINVFEKKNGNLN